MAKTRKITINCEDGNVEKALVTFFKSYEAQVVQFLQAILQREGVESDPTIALYEGNDKRTTELSVFRINPSKGNVIVSVDGVPSFVNYEELEENSKYLEEGLQGQWNVLLKTEKDEADATIGHFKSLKEGVSNIDSPQVEEAIKRRESLLNEQKDSNTLQVVKDAEVVGEEK